MKEILTIITILGITIIILFFGLPYLGYGLEQEESYPLYLLLVIEMLGIWTYRYFQHKDKKEDKKSGHTRRLNDNIFKVLTGLYIKRDHNNKYRITIPKQITKSHEGIIRPYYDTDLFLLETMPHPYWNWTKEHLKKYPTIKQSLDHLKEFEKKLTQYHDEQDKVIQNKIDEELNIDFQGFIDSKDGSRDQDIYSHYQIKTSIINNEKITPEKLEIFQWDDKTYSIVKKRRSESFLSSKDNSKLDLQKFCKALTNIMEDTQVKEAIEKFDKIRLESYEEEKTFKNYVALLVEELDTGDVLIKGSCDGCK